jgi:hypothetical protein
VKTRLARLAAGLGGRSWLVYPLLLLIAFSSWSISSPPGSSPDEDFHLVSIWCAQGQREGFCYFTSSSATRTVPADLIHTTCYAFHPNKAAVCPTNPIELYETSRGNFVGYYPNGFYLLMSVFAGASIEQSVVAMRLLNSLVFALCLGGLLYLTPPSRRANYILGSLVTLVPLGMFTVASINPSSWAITSATVLWASGVEFVHAPNRRRRIALGALCAAAFVIGLSARADAAAYAGLAVVLAWLATAKLARRTLWFGAVGGVVCVGAVVWAASLGSFAGLFNLPLARPEELPSGWWQRLQDLPGFYIGAFSRGLGWLDTPMRFATWVPASIAYFGAIFWGVRRVRWRKAVCMSLLLVLGTVVPIVLATARHALISEVLQQRYFLPLMIMMAMIALAEDNPDGPELGRAQAWVVVLALTIANANALHTNLRRYITGLDGKWFNLNINMQWWWSWAPPPMVVFGVGAAAFMGAVAVAALTGLRERDAPGPEAPAPRRALL